MAVIPLKKPIVHEGVTWSEFEFDPSLGALEDFDAAITAGKPELTALIALIAADGDIPAEVARRVRSSDLGAVQAEMARLDPLAASSTDALAKPGEDGEPSRPILHT